MNPIVAILNQQSGQSGIYNVINSIKNSNNPQGMLNSMMQNNPQIQQAMSYINQNGGNAKHAFYNLAKQKGIDPETILSQLR